MKTENLPNHRYQDFKGIIHACDSCQATSDNLNRLVWTKCEVDVPANKSYQAEQQVTCPICLPLINN